MAGRLETLADAVVSALNSGTFSQSFTAVRSWVPSFDLPDVSGIQVTVRPEGQEKGRLSRSSLSLKHEIGVFVTKKLSGTGNSEVDPVSELVQEIADYLLLSFQADDGQRFTDGRVIVCDFAQLQNSNVFQGGVIVTSQGVSR